MTKRILLVEDNPADEKLTLRAFKNCGVANEVVVVRDGAEALDYLFGTGRARRARSARRCRRSSCSTSSCRGSTASRCSAACARTTRTRLLPVVILTSSKEDEDVARSYELGANAYVRKPVDFAEFVAAAKTLGLFWLLLNEPRAGRRVVTRADPRPARRGLAGRREARHRACAARRFRRRRRSSASSARTRCARRSRGGLGRRDLRLVDAAASTRCGALAIVRASRARSAVHHRVGHDRRGVAVDAMRAGAHDYVLKDKLARLVPAIERELRDCERRAEHARRRRGFAR